MREHFNWKILTEFLLFSFPSFSLGAGLSSQSPLDSFSSDAGRVNSPKLPSLMCGVSPTAASIIKHNINIVTAPWEGEPSFQSPNHTAVCLIPICKPWTRLEGVSNSISYLMGESRVQAKLFVHIWQGQAESYMRQRIWLESNDSRIKTTSYRIWAPFWNYKRDMNILVEKVVGSENQPISWLLPCISKEFGTRSYTCKMNSRIKLGIPRCELLPCLNLCHINRNIQKVMEKSCIFAQLSSNLHL